MGKIRTGIKMRVEPEQSKKVQEICFENGIDWGSDKTLKHIDEPFLYISINRELQYSTERTCMYFIKDTNEEVSAELFIRTNGTCVESETTTEDNNKGEQMEELKLECLVEGYEGTYFEVGQVWETREVGRLKVVGFDFKKDIYKLIMAEVDDREEYYYTSKGEDVKGLKSDSDLVKLITVEIPTESTPTEESQPKTLSEYLKENNAYESFIENTIEAFLKHLAWYKVFKSENKSISLGNIFIFEDTKEGYTYWNTLKSNIPKLIEYDMNEVVFAEVDKRIAEQKDTTKYMVFVEGKKAPKVIHNCIASARREASRLSAKEIGLKVSVVEIICEFKSKVVVEEL